MMAEFQEVMKQWRRLCDSYDGCPECPLIIFEVNDYSCGGIGSMWAGNTDFGKIEDAIMQWAADHQEPVYPTWDEWLTEMGILQSPLPVPNMTVVAYYGGLKAHDHIPADIAEKLGIEPKGAGT